VLGLAVVYFLARVPDPIIAALDDRPPNVTILAADGTVGAVNYGFAPSAQINAQVASVA
jgi:hypothetical protein